MIADTVQDVLFDALVAAWGGIGGGVGRLSPGKLARIGGIARAIVELQSAKSAGDAKRIAGVIAAAIAGPKPQGRLMTAKMTLVEMANEWQRTMYDLDYEAALERDAIDKLVDFLRDKLSPDDLRQARIEIDHAVRHAVALMRQEPDEDADLTAKSAIPRESHGLHVNGGGP